MNLSTSSQRARYWRDTERRRKVWINRATNRAAQRFDEEGSYIVNLFTRFGIAAALLGVTSQAREWVAYLSGVYLTVANDFANRLFGSVPAPQNAETEDEQRRREQQRSDLVHAALLAFLIGQGSKKAREITDTSRERLEESLNEGVAAGETQPQLAERITSQYKTWQTGRAETIARTEVVAASNLGTQEAAKITVATIDLALNKVWVATPDNRTRPWHRAADGQQQGLDAFFLVNGEQLLYPGDWAHGASADNLVNCRCTVGYQVASAAQQRRAA